MGTCESLCKDGEKHNDATNSRIEPPLAPSKTLSWSDVPRLIRAVSAIQKVYRRHRKNKMLTTATDKV